MPLAFVLGAGTSASLWPLFDGAGRKFTLIKFALICTGAGAALLIPIRPAVLTGYACLAIGAMLSRNKPVPASAPLMNIGARTILIFCISLTAAAGICALRGPLMPTASGWGIFAFGAAVGLGVGAQIGTGASAALGSLGVCTVAAAAWSGPLDARMSQLAGALGRLPVPLAPLSHADHPALLVAGILGFGAGLLAAATNANGTERSIGVLSASAALIPTLSLFNTPVSVWAGRSLVTLGADTALRQRVEDARRDAPLQYAAVTPVGSALVWGNKDHRMLELDGAVVDPAGREVVSERFAGTLGACLTAGRDRARVAGDDLGVVAQALIAQGFHGIDTAIPDTSRMRVWAELDADARSAWVHPSTRILTLPAPFVAQIGARADLVVQVLRNGWGDARSTLPSPSALARTRRSLNPDGAYVLSVSTTRFDAQTFLGIASALGRAFPQLTIWLPPVGVDNALFVARTTDSPLTWKALDGCISQDRAKLRRDAIRTPADLAGLLLGDATTVPPTPTATGYRLPSELGVEPNPLPLLTASKWDPAPLWSADAPADDLRSRHEALARFQEVITRAGKGDMQGAIGQARALSETPGGDRSVETLVRGYLDNARALIIRGTKEGPDSKAWQAAETALGNVRLLYPDMAEAWCVQASMDEARGRQNLAEEAYEACFDKDEESLEALDGLARVRRVRGDLMGAEEAMRTAVEKHPAAWESKLNLGNLYIAIGRMTEAEDLIRAAIAGAARQDPPPTAPHLALAYLNLMTGRPALALGEAGLVLQQKPSAFAYCVRGAARFDLNQTDLAESDFRAGLESSPDNALCRSGLGGVQMTQKDYDGAVASFKAVLQLDPKNQQARENLQRLRDMGKTE
jgi:tetratricopeptide (TPR) repeat protein